MRASDDPLGKVLLARGAITEATLADVLEHQRRALPVGSLCYILGHLDEETLTRALSRQFGTPGLVLDQCVIRLDVLEAVPRATAIRHNVLPVYEDEQRIFLAAEDPEGISEVLRKIRFMRGKTPVVYVALHITLARTVRACYAARDDGDRYHFGPLAEVTRPDERGHMAVISEFISEPADNSSAPVEPNAFDDVTKEIDDLDLLFFDALDEDATGTQEHPARQSESFRDTHGLPASLSTEVAVDESPAHSAQLETRDAFQEPSAHPDTREVPTHVTPVELLEARRRPVLDLDEGTGVDYRAGHAGPRRVLIVDDDFATRHLLVKILQPLGIVTVTSSTGGEAIYQLKASPPDLVIIDVMLPEVDGFQICRAIKQSRKYNHISVILMSAVMESGAVTNELLNRYGVDAYFEKPIDITRIKRTISELLSTASAADPSTDDGFDRAVKLYKDGDVNGAIKALRLGLAVDPLSAKHHFVLANLLQKKSQLYEAIEEYEATVELKPDYFPALTRLAYLYYRKGFAAKAVEVWRRSLPFCTDLGLRQNIEAFIRRVDDEMQSLG